MCSQFYAEKRNELWLNVHIFLSLNNMCILTYSILILKFQGCWAIKLLSMNFSAFVSARALVGVLMAGSYVTCPLYTKEISEDSIRGMLGSLVWKLTCHFSQVFLSIITRCNLRPDSMYMSFDRGRLEGMNQ